MRREFSSLLMVDSLFRREWPVACSFFILGFLSPDLVGMFVAVVTMSLLFFQALIPRSSPPLRVHLFPFITTFFFLQNVASYEVARFYLLVLFVQLSKAGEDGVCGSGLGVLPRP